MITENPRVGSSVLSLATFSFSFMQLALLNFDSFSPEQFVSKRADKLSSPGTRQIDKSLFMGSSLEESDKFFDCYTGAADKRP